MARPDDDFIGCISSFRLTLLGVFDPHRLLALEEYFGHQDLGLHAQVFLGPLEGRPQIGGGGAPTQALVSGHVKEAHPLLHVPVHVLSPVVPGLGNKSGCGGGYGQFVTVTQWKLFDFMFVTDGAAGKKILRRLSCLICAVMCLHEFAPLSQSL